MMWPQILLKLQFLSKELIWLKCFENVSKIKIFQFQFSIFDFWRKNSKSGKELIFFKCFFLVILVQNSNILRSKIQEYFSFDAKIQNNWQKQLFIFIWKSLKNHDTDLNPQKNR